MHLTNVLWKIIRHTLGCLTARISWWRAAALMFPIGAGVLSIPFVMMQLGIVFGLLFIVGVGILMVAVHLMVAELVLRTKNRLEITGIVRKYSGVLPAYLMAFIFLALNLGALVAYLIGEGESLAALFGGPPFLWSVIFFGLGYLILRRGTRAVANYDLLIGGAVIIILLLIALVSFGFTARQIVTVEPIWFPPGSVSWWVPFGVLLFAFHGVAAIPPAGVLLTGDVKDMRRAVLFSSLTPIFFYGLFAVTVVLVTGYNTSEVATIGLGKSLGAGMVVIGNLFAIGAMSISFLTLGEAVRRTWQWDFGVSARFALLLAVLIPFVIYALGARDFVRVIAVVGAGFGSLEIILLLITYWRMQKIKTYEENRNFGRRFWWR